MTNVLSRASRSDVRLDPFPHAIVEEALDRGAYAALAASFPSPDILAGALAPDRLGSNRRYSMPAWPLMLHDAVAPAWKDFVESHLSGGFFRAVLSLFDGHWDTGLLDRLKRAEEQAPGLLYRDDHRHHRVLVDARIEINSPVVADGSSPRGAHLDTPNRVYSALFYLRDDEDDSTGGELELFRWKSQPAEPLDRFEVPADAVERVGTIPYRANQLVIFPQSVAALHGVGIRHPTAHIRRYVFITAEIEEDWLIEQRAAIATPAGVRQ